MRGARSRRGAWVSEAIELKRKMDRAYFDYKYALDGLAARLSDVPDQDLAAQVRERIDAALKRATDARAAARRL
jgi:type VI protein secretion system component VasF